MTSLSPNYKKISHGERFLNSSGNVIFAHYCETLHHPFELRPSCFFSLVNAVRLCGVQGNLNIFIS